MFLSILIKVTIRIIVFIILIIPIIFIPTIPHHSGPSTGLPSCQPAQTKTPGPAPQAGFLEPPVESDPWVLIRV